MADPAFEITSRDLSRVAAELKVAGEGEFRKQLLARVRKAAAATIPDVRDAARSRLPHGGGLAERVAGQAYAVRGSYAAAGATVSITGKGMKGLKSIDEGRVRHPVYGDRSTWVEQAVPPGFFSETIAAHAPAIRTEIGHAVDDINRSVR